MLFSDFAKYLKRLEDTPSRLEITAILKELFDKTEKLEIKEVVYLSLGILAPNYEGVLLNLAEKMVIRTLSLSYNIDLEGLEGEARIKAVIEYLENHTSIVGMVNDEAVVYAKF